MKKKTCGMISPDCIKILEKFPGTLAVAGHCGYANPAYYNL
jgi:hypothetical protein